MYACRVPGWEARESGRALAWGQGATVPKSYRYYHCDNFPELGIGETIETEEQLALPYGDRPANSSFRHLGLATDDRFERYEVVHQIEVRMRVVWQQETVSKVLRELEFPAYYNRREGYFLVGTGKREAAVLFRRLQKLEIDATAGRCDLTQLLQQGVTTGGYFRDLAIRDVKSAAIFGTSSVVDSEEWAHYADVGDISAVYMSLGPADARVMVTADRLVLVLTTQSEHDDLRLVAHVNELIEAIEAAE